MFKILFFVAFLSLTSCSTTYYVVRHAEKAPAITMTSDVPLSKEGEERAIALKDSLANKKIRHIFSTNYVRTKATAQPLSNTIGMPIQTYDPKDTTFITKLRSLKGNILIVGHSNTVDDLINGLIDKKQMQDLPDNAYGDLFIVIKGKNEVQVKHFGK
jgi:broad specificity phosphatase PhoE